MNVWCTAPTRAQSPARCTSGWTVGAGLGLALLFATAITPASAQGLDRWIGERALIVQTRDGATTRIGSVFFSAAPERAPLPSAAQTPPGDGPLAFRIQMDHAVLKDYFLSMREFKCLPAEVEVTCFVPYPYAHPGTIASGDLGWLEHNLLFLYKRPRDFGAKLWNGMIFKLSLTDKGFVGQPQAVDLNRISAPPEDLGVQPYGPLDRDDFAPDARWITELRIE